MNSKGGTVLLAALVLAPGLAAATPESNDTPPAIRWAVRADTPASSDVPLVEWTHVGYEADVYGGTSMGTLTFAFSYKGQEAVTVRFALTPPSTVEVLGVALESAGRLDELAI